MSCSEPGDSVQGAAADAAAYYKAFAQAAAGVITTIAVGSLNSHELSTNSTVRNFVTAIEGDAHGAGAVAPPVVFAIHPYRDITCSGPDVADGSPLTSGVDDRQTAQVVADIGNGAEAANPGGTAAQKGSTDLDH